MEFLGDVPGVRANKFTEGRRGEEKFGEKHPHAIHRSYPRYSNTYSSARAPIHTHTHICTYPIVNRTWCGNWFDGQGWVWVAASLKRRISTDRAIDSGIEETRKPVEFKIAKSRWDAGAEAAGRIGQFNTLANRVTPVTRASRSVPMSLPSRANPANKIVEFAELIAAATSCLVQIDFYDPAGP